MLVPGIIAQPAAGTRIWARIMSNVSRSPVDGRLTVTLTGVPSSPRTSAATWSVSRPATDSPSTSRNLVAGEHARILRRAVTDDRHDDDRALTLAEDDADADHVAAQRVLLAGDFLGGQEDRVAGVAERLDQAANRAVGQLRLVQLAAADVVVADGLQRLPEQVEVGRCAGRQARPGSVARLAGRARWRCVGGRARTGEKPPPSNPVWPTTTPTMKVSAISRTAAIDGGRRAAPAGVGSNGRYGSVTVSADHVAAARFGAVDDDSGSFVDNVATPAAFRGKRHLMAAGRRSLHLGRPEGATEPGSPELVRQRR